MMKLFAKKRSVVHQQKLYFRAVNAFICNDQNQLWIPRRHADKKIFPLALDCSVSGHVSSGEEYDAAFERETAEEVNIDITKVPYKKIARLTPITHNVVAFMWVYIIYSNEAPHFNTDDFSEYYWLTPDELIARLQAGEYAKSDLMAIVQDVKDKL